MFAFLSSGSVGAQTVDYFSTPWLVAPLQPNSQGESQLGQPVNRVGSNIYSRASAQASPAAPPWSLAENLGIDELVTDNVRETENGRTGDLGSLISAGVIGSADTARLTGVLSATGVYRRQLVDSALNGFSGYGYANGQLAIMPGWIYLGVHGLMDNLSRPGTSLLNPLVQTSQTTQTYSINAAPYAYNRVGDVGVNVLRYQVGEVWFSNNTGALQFPGQALAPISATIDQSAREDFRMAGTFVPRLMSDISLNASDSNSGHLGEGDYTNVRGEFINEYELTRSVSGILGGGYEQLHDNLYPNVDGEGPVWDVGTRLQPNADSYALLVYGRHDLKSDVAGEIWWKFTESTSLYAAYTDSVTNSQQSILGNVTNSQPGPLETGSTVTYDQSTVVGTLTDSILNAGPDNILSLEPSGTSLSDLNNALPIQNGLFRVKLLRATARSLLADGSLSLTGYYLDSTQLTSTVFSISPIGQVTHTDAVFVNWLQPLSADIDGLSSFGYSRLNTSDSHGSSGTSDAYDFALGATKVLSGSLSLVLRYDLIYHVPATTSGGYLQNTFTLGLHKTFD